jgi:hypothetical protein
MSWLCANATLYRSCCAHRWCTCVCACATVRVRPCVCGHACLRVSVYLCVCLHAVMRVYVCMRVRACDHACVHVYVCVYNRVSLCLRACLLSRWLRRCQSNSFNASCRCLCRHTTRSALEYLCHLIALLKLFILLYIDCYRTRQTTCSSCQTRPRTCCLCCWAQCRRHQLSCRTFCALSRFVPAVFLAQILFDVVFSERA